jgi:hypothetical protein
VRVVSAVVVSLALGGVAVASAATAVLTAPIHVSPAAGGPRTVFTVSFRAPDRTGVVGSLRRFDQISASVPPAAGSGGCLTTLDATVPAANRGSRVVVRLDPHDHAGRWCVGTYRGQIEELAGPVCKPGLACPAFVALLGTIGRFSFEVRSAGAAPRPSADRTPPSFGGLQRAFACTPGPQRPGQTTPFTLSWQAASDNVTPSSQIVYEIYLASAPGGERFSAPTWTSAPGATTFRTPGLPSHGSFYFVVRARDAAGNEDGNTIERHGSDPCL